MAAFIVSFASPKGGVGKSSLAQTVATSRAFTRRFKRVCIVELDPQGTLADWHRQRAQAGRAEGVDFASIDLDQRGTIEDRLDRLQRDYDALVLDVPGESRARAATNIAAMASDLVVIPTRWSTKDEHAFTANLLPAIHGHLAACAVLPVFVHPATSTARLVEYWSDLPEGIGVLRAAMPQRSVFEVFDFEGATLHEYAQSVKRNARQHAQALKAIQDIEQIAREILRHA